MLVNGLDGHSATAFSGVTITLTADIDLLDHYWTPIGTSTSNYFKGTFDGGGHTISNLTINTDASYVGLFGATSGATLKNVTLDKPQVQNSAGGTSYTGALVGFMAGNGTTEYCAVTNGSVSSAGKCVGGLIGYFLVGTVQYCYNYETTVSSTNDTPIYVNGVAGRAGTGEYLYSSFSYVSQQKGLKASNNAQYAAYLSETSTKRAYGINGGQYGFSADQFKDGTVAYFLRTGFYGGNAKYTDWGQTIGKDDLPKWKGEAVESLQYGRLGADGKAEDTYAYFNALTQGTDGTYHIEDTSDWIAFVKLVKVDKNYSANAVVKEGTVIDFSQFGTLTNKSAYSYLVIADCFSDEPYTGTFIGNGCTVKGVSYSGTMEFALFGTIGKGGSVSGITLETPEITGTTAGAYNIAGIASHNYGIIDDCHVDGGTISTVTTTAAGIAAESFGTVKNCTNSADITAKYQVAGIVATSNSTSSHTSAEDPMVIEGCSNSGTITATNAGSSCAGGIFGGKAPFSGGTYPYGTISKCFNTGNILGQSYIGGIVGYSIKNANASAANVTIENCYNTGAIGDANTTGVAGGISAGTSSSVTNCFNMGDVTGTYAQPIVANGNNTQAWSDNSYASCEVNGPASGSYLYYGEDDGAYLGPQDEQGRYCRGNGKRTNVEMASGEVAYLLQQGQDDDEQVWSQRIGEDDRPVLVSNGEPAPVVLITVMLVDENETTSELAKCYTNAGSTLSAYPKPDDQGAVYTFYTDTSCTETNKIDTATKTYSTDTTIYVKQSKLPDLEGTVTIAGTPKTGEKLTANVTGTPDDATLSYQWYRCKDASGETSTAIDGATDSTYTVTKADTGKYIKVVVTAANYSGSLSAVTSQVKENPATVSSAPAAKENLVYNGSAQELVTEGTATGGTMMYSLDENNNFSADIPTATDAGDYTVYYYVQGDDTHSDSTTGSVEVTIDNAPLTVTGVTATDRAYNGTDKVAITAVTLDGVKNNDTVSVDMSTSTLTGTVDSPDVGTYKTLTLPSTLTLTGEDAANYTLPADGVKVTTVNGGNGVSISKATSTIEFNNYAPGKTYDGQPLANPTSNQLTITGAEYEDVTFTWYEGTAPNSTKLDSAPKDAGTYYLVASISDSGNTSRCQATSGPITINPAVISINSATVADKTYDGKTDATMESVTFSDNVQLKAADYTATAVFTDASAKDNQSATVTVELKNGNYTFADNQNTDTTTATAKISPLAVTLSWSTPTSFTYDGTPKTVTATVTNKVGNDAFELTYENNAKTDVGSYTAKVTGLGNDNYTLTGASGTEQAWSIGVASIAGAEVTLSPESFTYDGSEQKPTVTVTLGEEELTEDTDYTVSYSGNCVDADTYTVTVTGKGNYSGTAASKTYTIEKATVTPSISGTASKTYDGTTAATGLTITLESAVQGDDVTATAASYTYNSANVAEANTVTASGITLDGEDAGNYTLSALSAQAAGTITRAALTVTADAKSKTYGEADPELTYTATGLKGDDTLTGELSRETGENVGEHAITQGSLAAGSNYTLTFTGAKFTITARPVTLSWSTPTSFTYDGQLHSVTAEVTNAVDGDTFTLAYEDNAKTDAGTYTAKVTGLTGTDAANYTLTGATTTQAWRIVRATVTITVKDQTARVGDAVPTEFDADDYTVTGLLGDDTLTKQPALQVVTTSDLVRNGRLVKTGKLVISATGAEAENYDILYKTGTLTVLEALPTRYPISVEDTAHGTVTVDNRAEAGETVTITVTPEEGYSLSSLTVTDRDGSKLELAPQGGGKYTFEMPSSSVTIRAVFVPEELPFVDVKPTDWFYDAVSYVYWSSMMDGVSADRFAPDSDVTRAMVWTVLARIDGETITGSDWAEDARAWAMENGISDGTNPMSPVTREQLAAMLYRYAGSPAVSGSLSDYPDAEQVSDWARDAMLWATENGIINGIGGKLSPASGATRAQLATMLMRFAARLS